MASAVSTDQTVLDAGPPATPPPLRAEEERVRQLRVMKRRATGLLVVSSVLFVLLILLTDDRGWAGYARALATGSMVGGLADWFAVTALFRHPLGLPIPHTAVIVERKDQFGRTLGEFVQQNFLSSDVIADRVRSARTVERTADWLSDPANARLVAEHAANVAVGLADVLRDEDVQRMLDEEIALRVTAAPVAPLAARALRAMTAADRHHDLLDAILRGMQRTLLANRAPLRERFGQESPWWLPDAVDDRIFDRLFDGVCAVLERVNTDHDDELRAHFEQWLTGLADRLEHSPELAARADDLKHEVLENPELRRWSASLWSEAKTTLRTQAADPDSELRRRLAETMVAAGQRLRTDPVLAAKVEEVLVVGARYVADHFHDEIADLVTGTISRWEATEASRRLELLLGRDLQFIRINGTVVGGLAALVIHGVAQQFG
jgi:uncharacterized membrane-anchored protein YjiN (DUF445 family)